MDLDCAEEQIKTAPVQSIIWADGATRPAVIDTAGCGKKLTYMMMNGQWLRARFVENRWVPARPAQ